MSAGKKIIIAAMVLIVLAIGLVIFLAKGNKDTTAEKLARAEEYYNQMDYDKTIAIYNEILSSNAGCTEAYLGLADAYTVKGNSEKAFEILERGVEATNSDERITDKISELSGEASDNEDTEEAVAEVTSVPESETETETETPTAAETTAEPEETTSETTTAETTETTTEATTTAAPVTTTVTTAATTRATTRAATAVTEKPTISVPNFIGITKEEAAALAKKKNISLTFEYEKNDTYANGVVFYQSHREGSLVSSKTAVSAYVCVNDTKYVSEEDRNLQDFYKAVKSWGDGNTDRVTSVELNEKSSTVTVKAASIKRFVIDESVITAFSKCKNANLYIVSSDAVIAINSSSVTSAAKLDLSSDVYSSSSRATFSMSHSGNFCCTMTVTLTGCNVSHSDLEDMNLYFNEKKSGTFKLTSNSEPIITVSKGGTYVIK